MEAAFAVANERVFGRAVTVNRLANLVERTHLLNRRLPPHASAFECAVIRQGFVHPREKMVEIDLGGRDRRYLQRWHVCHQHQP